MARKCICRGCGKHLTTDIAYKVIENKKNIYYCTKEEYEELQKKKVDKEECLVVVAELLQLKFVPPSLLKQLNTLNELYDYVIITKTFKECADKIRWFMDNKSSDNDFANFKYVITIVANNINSVYKKYQKEQKEIQKLFTKKQDDIDVDIMNDISIKETRIVSDISDFLD